jgi:hypothetical protein
LLPGEHKVRAPLTIAELADPDDGQLQTQLILDTGSLEQYLAGAGELSDEFTLATGTDTSSLQGGGIQFVGSDDDEGLPIADNVEGHLMGLLEARGADPHDECAQHAGDEYGDSNAETYTAALQVPQAHMDARILQRVLDMLRARGGQFANRALASAAD